MEMPEDVKQFAEEKGIKIFDDVFQGVDGIRKMRTLAKEQFGDGVSFYGESAVSFFEGYKKASKEFQVFAAFRRDDRWSFAVKKASVVNIEDLNKQKDKLVTKFIQEMTELLNRSGDLVDGFDFEYKAMRGGGEEDVFRTISCLSNFVDSKKNSF